MKMVVKHVISSMSPEVLIGKYQSFTEADTTKLMAAGYDKGFTPLADAVKEYCELLDNNEGYLR